MSRPTSIDTQHVLAAAREVFLERGILATTAEVARRAGVSEGSLFRRYATKEELFRAAMFAEDHDPPWIATLAERAGMEPIEVQLRQFGLTFLDRFRKIAPLVMMAWSNGTAEPRGTGGPPMRRRIAHVARWFAREMELGRLRSGDPEIFARSFVGALQHLVFTELLTGVVDDPPPERFVAGLVDVWLNGAAPVVGEEA
jgi:AcrR family transcriptional regulator